MLRTARRLPRRFNRRISSRTQAIVRQRRARSREYAFERIRRIAQRIRRRMIVRKSTVVAILSGVAAAAVLAAIGFLLFSPFMAVHEVRVQRTDPRIDFEQVQNALEPVYGRRMFFLSAQDVRQMLHEAIPDLAGVEVAKDYPRSIVLQLQYDPIVAQLQIRDPDGVIINHLGSGAGLGADYLTSKGMYVVYPDSVVGSGTQLPLVDIVDWGVRPGPWTELIEPEMLDTIQKAELALLEQFSLQTTQRTVYVRAHEFHLALAHFSLWFDLRSPLEEQLQRLRIFINAVGLDVPKEYVDLRVKDAVMYK